MNPASPTRASLCSHRRRESGYAILLVLFFVTLILIGTIAIAPNLLTERRRERETEMIWRGRQYIRGIKLYYRKTRKFPTSLDDLTKPQIGNVRFMRRAYKDPMNSKDGEWRLIYVGPNGQLIGSLKPLQTIQLAGLQGVLNAPPNATDTQIRSLNIGQGLGQPGNSILGGATAGGTGGNANAGVPSNLTAGANSSSTDNSSAGAIVPDPSAAAATSEAANEALLESDAPVVMGGNIIGVASKVNQSSIAVYEKAKNYKQFEFIWDPSKDAIMVGGAAGPQIGTPVGQPGQSSPLGTPANPNANPNSPGSTLNPQPSPPETTPQPPPQQP